MKKLLRHSVGLAILAVSASALASCGEKRFEFWSSFGAAYTNYLDGIVNDINEETGYGLKHITKGSYDGIRTAVNSARSTKDHPSLMTGYPDHFADYLGGGILVQLNKYIDEYNSKNGGSLLDDYYPDYLTENMELDIYKAADGTKKAAVSALPFNKSTELMGYNGTFVDYCATIDESLGTVPQTWQQWKVQGPKYRAVLDTLVKKTDPNNPAIVLEPGKKLYFNQREDGSAYDFSIDVKESRTGVLDFTSVDSKETRVISWDSTDNMFITLLRQWGSEYTKLPESEKEKDPRRRKGHIRFNAEENKAATKACLQFFNEMNADKVFGVPAIFGSSYSSDAFAANKVMFMLCSSGGLSYNTDSWNQRFRVAPLPYYDDGVTVRKFVISQGANIALSNQGGEDMIKKGFDVMTKLTRGSYQARWCLSTGYYPCSKSARNDPAYDAFLKGTSYDNATEVAYREGSVLNDEEYMNAAKGWTKFVDPAFMGSSEIRTEIKKVFEKVFSDVKLDEHYEPLASNAQTYDDILKYACDQFKSSTSIIVD